MNSKKTILPSLRNTEWRTLKIETNKINQVLRYIITNNVTELNELIYAEAKLVFEKTGKEQGKNLKPGWEIRLETQMKNLRKWTKMIKQRKMLEYAETERKRQHEKKKTEQLEEINQKVLAKEGRLKRYRQRQ